MKRVLEVGTRLRHQRAVLGSIWLGTILTTTAVGAPAPVTVFEDVWSVSKAEIYDEARSQRFFTPANYQRLKAQAQSVKDLEALSSEVLNPFLSSLGVSHTRFFTRADLAYYVLRSLFTYRDIERPKVHHIGIQLAEDHVIREVFDGFPAAEAGLWRGDRLVAVDGKPYRSVEQYQGAQTVTVTRRGKTRTVPLRPVYRAITASLRDATDASVRVMERGGARIGYVHLWVGTFDETRERFAAHVRAMKDVDGMIVDLRGGFGGAGHGHLDPFFADRGSYFAYVIHPRTGETETIPAKPQKNVEHYPGPLVVLINEGTRSGKESLAYQFKKTGRAKLVGTTTKGAFTAGRGVFADRNDGYQLYLAVAEWRLDGARIEGVGVKPDVEVPFPFTGPSGVDPQLDAGLRVLDAMLTPQPAVNATER